MLYAASWRGSHDKKHMSIARKELTPFNMMCPAVNPSQLGLKMAIVLQILISAL
jgi:hypothetical protein